MLIHDTKVCDRCCRNTHHVEFPCCRSCAGMVPCKACQEKARRAPVDPRNPYRRPRINSHHRRFPCCRECAQR